MKAAIQFNVYDDYAQFLNPDIEWYQPDDYQKAFEVLKKDIESLIKKKQLTILYKRKRVKILGPMSISDCGNIFSKEEQDIPEWNAVEVWCEIPCEYQDFDWDSFVVGKCPDYFEPTGRLTRIN